MYTLEQLVTELRDPVHTRDFNSVQNAVRRAVSEKPLATDLGRTHVLHDEPGLMLLHTVVGGGFASPPHDHRTWAVIGVYHGHEDNTFYRLVGDTRAIAEAGGRRLAEREVMMLGANAIHKISNPRGDALVALHVYGLNIFKGDRSAWDPATGIERPFDVKLDSRVFAAGERR